MTSERKCPVMHGKTGPQTSGSFSNRHWWPNQLNLKVLHQNAPAGDPMGEGFDYAKAFESLDYVAAHLGGATGRFLVGGESIDLTATPSASDDVVFYLDQTSNECDGDNCIQGHTWLTHAIVYHSAGARTKQVSGGTVRVQGTRCRTGAPVYHEGRPMCRLLNQDAWQYNHSTGELELAAAIRDPFRRLPNTLSGPRRP